MLAVLSAWPTRKKKGRLRQRAVAKPKQRPITKTKSRKNPQNARQPEKVNLRSQKPKRAPRVTASRTPKRATRNPTATPKWRSGAAAVDDAEAENQKLKRALTRT